MDNKENKDLTDAFDRVTPPESLRDKTRDAVYAAERKKQAVPVYSAQPAYAGANNAAPRPVKKQSRWVSFTAIVILLVLVIMIPVSVYYIVKNNSIPDGTLRSFSSIAEVTSYVKARSNRTPSSLSFGCGSADMTESADGAATANSNSSNTAANSNTEHSTTNNQVEGVAESDTVHTDGDYIYMLSYYSLAVIDIRGGGYNAALEMDYENFFPSEMFLLEEEGKLIVIGNYYYPRSQYYDTYSYGADKAVSGCCYWQANALMIKIYDIPALLSAGGAAEPERELSFENCYLSGTRMIESKLYMVINAYSYMSYDNSQVWLPGYSDSDCAESGEIKLPAPDIFATPDDGRMSYNFTLIAGFDISGGESEVKAYFGSVDTLYASKNAFYILYSRYKKTTFLWYESYEYLGRGIMRFEITGVSLDYKGRGTVDGSVINQFAMDEYIYAEGENAGKTYFRIATTSGGESHITVFDPDMQQVGMVSGIGKGERIYSVRFDGLRAVVVTYRQMDPFYVIDLSDPAEPFIKSELKIPGVSDYLHFMKIKDGYVFAIGRRQSDSGTWLDGIKVSVFDITGDETKEVYYDEVTTSKYGYSSSEATYNHKAVMYFMPESGGEEVLAFPVSVYGNEYNRGAYYYYNYSDLYYYSTDKDGKTTPSVLGYHAEDQVYAYSGYDYSYYYYYRDSVRRSVIAGEYIYLIGYGGVERYDRGALPGNHDIKGDIISVGGQYWKR